MSMKPMYCIEEYYSGVWQSVATADTLNGIIENLIDLHNDPDTISEGAYRLTFYDANQAKTIVYPKEPTA